MTTIQLDRPAPQAPIHRSRWDKADLAARILLLAVIGLGWLSIVPAHLAASRPATQFTTDLKAGKVTSVEYVRHTRSLRWADGGIRWYAADLSLGRPPVGPSPDQMSSDGLVPREGDTAANVGDRKWGFEAIDAAGQRLRLDVADAGDNSWASTVPWRGLPLAASIAAILSFFLMLGRDWRRFGTRWAWFWIFALVGWGIAPALSLLLEPAPLWFRKSRPMPVKPAFTGLAALVAAVGLKAALAGSGVGFFGMW
jgi:hypothetical protein